MDYFDLKHPIKHFLWVGRKELRINAAKQEECSSTTSNTQYAATYRTYIQRE